MDVDIVQGISTRNNKRDTESFEQGSKTGSVKNRPRGSQHTAFAATEAQTNDNAAWLCQHVTLAQRPRSAHGTLLACRNTLAAEQGRRSRSKRNAKKLSESEWK